MNSQDPGKFAAAASDDDLVFGLFD
ncbi:unnamed protein product [Coffea canephora]|uniref:Uncharacterized protein n=1 Tax=Coffea canephora TaxID=49390 RepID=A0A068ULT4_COFCA|nr:unnamed protein product [Coffea canephora]